MELHLHHVGIVVKDIPSAVAEYVTYLGYEITTEIIHDPLQTAFVQFLRLPGERVFMEFVAPDGEESKLTNALRKGGGLNHTCYATEDIDQACEDLRCKGMFLLQAPVAAAAFPGRRIAWLMGRLCNQIELVEQRGMDGLP
jgi:methylmalonyl-CoA/ethylmalonyl-CoA epimerase